jgi:hypothetical protein
MNEERDIQEAKLHFPKLVGEGSKSPLRDSLTYDFKETIGNLKRQRGVLKVRITSFEKYISKFQNINLDKSEMIEINLRISQLESVYVEFNKLQSKIECCSEEHDLLIHIEYRENFEE